jgi:hypothetical protein
LRKEFFPEEAKRPPKQRPHAICDAVAAPDGSAPSAAIVPDGLEASPGHGQLDGTAPSGTAQRHRPYGKKPAVTILKKMQILARFKELAQLGARTKREEIIMAEFPESLTSYGMIYRWRNRAAADKWHLLDEATQKVCKEVPNYLRPSLGLKKSKGNRPDRFLPIELHKEYDKVLCARLHGTSNVKAANELLKGKNVVAGMRTLISTYNQRANCSTAEITRKNTTLWKELENGKISIETAKARLRRHLPQACI